MKSVQNRVISGLYFPVFSLNTGKHRPDITPYLDTFHAVWIWSMNNYFLKNWKDSHLSHLQCSEYLIWRDKAFEDAKNCRNCILQGLMRRSENCFLRQSLKKYVKTHSQNQVKKKFSCLRSTLRFFWKFHTSEIFLKFPHFLRLKSFGNSWSHSHIRLLVVI